MNGLTDRLQMIADEIKQGETMADIGTDHGFLPLHLWESGISPKVIMCDISEPSLAKAKAASGAYQFGNELDFRAGDGLTVLKSGEVDDIVIAGMGGLLIWDIMSKDMDKTCSFQKFILQPRNHAGTLRYRLASAGFDIAKNQLVREGKFICEIITVKPPTAPYIGDFTPLEALPAAGESSAPDGTAMPPENAASWDLPEESEPVWDLPEDLLENQPELSREYAAVKLGIEEKIPEGMKRGSGVSAEEIAQQQNRVEYFRNYGRRL